MSSATRPILAGAVLGTIIAGVFAIPGLLPTAVASDIKLVLNTTRDAVFPPAFDPDGLLKPKNYDVAPSVSLEPSAMSVVRKIAFGKETLVTVMKTPTGVYSSDALASPHVEYPGIRKLLPSGDAPEAGTLAVWDGDMWRLLRVPGADSFVTLVPDGGAKVIDVPAEAAPADAAISRTSSRA